MMISEEKLGRSIRDLQENRFEKTMMVCEHYGERREEIFGYILSFREHISYAKLDEVLWFFVLLVSAYERETGLRIYPSRESIHKANQAVRAQVEFTLKEEPSNLSRQVDLWINGFEEKALLAYAMHEIIAKCDVKTEEGIQMYIAILSLILIFSEEAGAYSREVREDPNVTS